MADRNFARQPGRRLTRTHDTSKGGEDEGASIITLTPSFMLGMSTKRSDDCLNTEGWIGDETWLVTTEIRESVSITWPDVPAGLPKKKSTQLYVLQMVSGEILPVLKEALVHLTMGL
jgi:hypothetical protein